MLESWFQASLQVYFLIFFDESAEDDSLAGAIRISGLVISCLSILYGLSTYNIRKILRTEPNIVETFLFTVSEFTTSTVIFLYILIPYLIAYVMDDNIINGRIAYAICIVICNTYLWHLPTKFENAET